MMLSTHFSLDEFIASDTAARLGIDNDLPAELYSTAKHTAEMLEAIRAHLGAPVVVSSGYRCPLLNHAIGSADTSDHPKAMAADIKVPAFGSPAQVARELASFIDRLGIGQVILEFGAWTHVSTRIPDKVINRIITIDKDGTHVGIVE